MSIRDMRTFFTNSSGTVGFVQIVHNKDTVN